MIRWSGVAVEQALGEVAAHLREAEPHLEKAHDAVKRGYAVPNLPQYMHQRLSRLEEDLDWQVRRRPLQDIIKCRNDIPEGAIEAEKKAQAIKAQQPSLVR